MRLNKYIAQAGLASRRKADELTLAGNVKINGLPMKQPGYDVVQGDVVEVNGRVIETSYKPVYIMLNKPRGYITSVTDDRGRATVMELVNEVDERIFPIGRLDLDTSGLLLLTNDGEMAYKLTHPKNQIFKTYRAKVTGFVTREKAGRLRSGVDIGGFITSKAEVEVIKQAEKYSIVDIQIAEGKNRQVRKMFAAVGHKVLELERTAVGELRLGHLKEGHYRKLTTQEIEFLNEC